MTEAIPRDALHRFVTAPIRASTYKRLVYLLLAFPLGLAYFVVFTTASSLGVGLAFTVVGIPILVGTLIATTAAARLEARLAERLLGRETAHPRSLRRSLDTDDGYVAALRRFLAAPTTWTSVAVVLLKFLYGLAAFVITVTGSTMVVAMLAAPAVYDDPNVSYRIGGLVVSTLPEALAVAGLGAIGVWVVCNVCNALATAGGMMTDVLLSVGREADP
ncbi:sensor domain-containing protein [Halobellus ruber]|uniref:Sensor domain-containing protein n=1 Tax=Halobellus ruber TaxID=2761102 RepID=A0A7J9SJ32_9EURY|nr:sensor domain-containing protein [Halobellus ruber]MBB6646542.1 sensor domain-containing protein [Halobellus ruber]